MIVTTGTDTDLSVKEFAKRARLNPRTVYRAINAEEIRAYRVRRAVRIPLGELYRLRGVPAPPEQRVSVTAVE